MLPGVEVLLAEDFSEIAPELVVEEQRAQYGLLSLVRVRDFPEPPRNIHFRHSHVQPPSSGPEFYHKGRRSRTPAGTHAAFVMLASEETAEHAMLWRYMKHSVILCA